MKIVIVALTAFVAAWPATARAQNPINVDAAVARGIEILISSQEDLEGKHGGREWPYQGVYRVGGKIPMGYRVGGTAIGATALIESPGYKKDKKRQKSVQKAVAFVLKGLGDPIMSKDFKGTYDVRGWGQSYALIFLLRLEAEKLVPHKHKGATKKKIKWLIDTIQRLEIPERGGWAYARRGGVGSTRNKPSPFQTVPTLHALFLANALGYKVQSKIIERGLTSLERTRTASGGYAYNTPHENWNNKDVEENGSMMDKLPGSIGRMAAVEATLTLAGRGDLMRLEHAVQSFFKHWKELEVRRRQNGTHIQPYGVAPYYFCYAHYYVSLAIELLPDGGKKTKARRDLQERFATVREKNGGWNDRVFDRSENYGTATAIMALQMEHLKKTFATWSSKQ